MRGVDVLLLAFDHAWGHRWESLTQVLAGVTAEEASWQAPAYAGEEREEGWPLPGSIHWQVAHIAHCKRHYRELLVQADRSARPPVPPRTLSVTFEEERLELERAHAAQRAAIAALADQELGTRVGDAMTAAEFVSMCTRHDAWHASQVAVARRLYRSKGA